MENLKQVYVASPGLKIEYYQGYGNVRQFRQYRYLTIIGKVLFSSLGALTFFFFNTVLARVYSLGCRKYQHISSIANKKAADMLILKNRHRMQC